MNRNHTVCRWCLLSVAAVAFAMFASGSSARLHADEPAAKKLVEATRKLLEEAKSDAPVIRLTKLEQAKKNFKLISVELADVDGDAKTALEKEVKALQEQATTLAESGALNDSVKLIDELIAAAKESLGNPDTLEPQLKEAETVLKKADVKKALGDAKVASVTKQIAALRKASQAQQHDADIEQFKKSIERLENELPDALKAIGGDDSSDRDSAIRNFQGRDYQLIEKIIERMPADDADAKPLIARFRKVNDPFLASVAKVNGGEAAERLKRSWTSYADDFAGWDKETTVPKFDELTKRQSAAMSALGMPKTVALASRATEWLTSSVDESEDLKPLLTDAPVKGIVDQVRGNRDAAQKKLVAAADSILKDAAAATLNQSSRDRLESFVNDDLRHALEGSAKLEDLQARGKVLLAKFDQAAGGAAADKEKRYDELVQKAQSDWPAMLKQYKPQAGFDPTKGASWKGKVVHFAAVNNRLGWDYKTDSYHFAMSIDGHPVAGRFVPAIRAEVKKVLAETGKDALPEEPCDVVAVVGGSCKLQRRVNREGKVVVEGVTANVESESWEPEDAVLLQIVAFRCGPVAIAVKVDEASSAATAAASSSDDASGTAGSDNQTGAATAGEKAGSEKVPSGGGGSAKWVALLLGLLASSLALIKANFAPLVSVPQVHQLRLKVGDDTLGKIGLILAALGIYWLIRGWLFYGLLTSGTLAAAGLFAGADTLVGKGLLKPEMADKLKPYGSLIGLACGAAAIVQLITGGALHVI